MIEQTTWLTWLLLTKRPQIAAAIVPEHWKRNGWPKNAWPGTSAVTQKWADLRIPALLKIPESNHFLSAEPLSERLELSCHVGGLGLSWVIAGGQSGKDARPMHPDWAQSLRDQCVLAGVPFFFKQWGEWTPGVNVQRQTGIVQSASWLDDRWIFGRENLASSDGHIDDEPDLYRVGKNHAGRILDGREWNEFPEVTHA
jgi:protein gp37